MDAKIFKGISIVIINISHCVIDYPNRGTLWIKSDSLFEKSLSPFSQEAPFVAEAIFKGSVVFT